MGRSVALRHAFCCHGALSTNVTEQLGRALMRLMWESDQSLPEPIGHPRRANALVPWGWHGQQFEVR